MRRKTMVAEFIGTFALIFIGAGAVAVGVGGVVGAAFAHGLVVLVFAYAYGHISGTHINPAVTLGMLIVKEIDLQEAVAYWVAQFLGGIAGGIAIWAVVQGTDITVASGMTMLGPGVTWVGGFALEVILTFFLMNAILNTAVSGKGGNFSPIAIGLTLTFSILMGGPLTGGSLNPARTLGPAVAALFEGTTAGLAMFPLYLIATCLGAVLAALLYQYWLRDA